MVLIVIMPITAYISKLYLRYQDELLAAADQRLELAAEVVSQLRIVKFFAWETKFIEKMEVARKKELAAVWRRQLAVTVGWNLTFGTPVLVGVVTFVTQTKVLHRPLTAETAFTALALFTVLRGPLEGFTDSACPVFPPRPCRVSSHAPSSQCSSTFSKPTSRSCASTGTCTSRRRASTPSWPSRRPPRSPRLALSTRASHGPTRTRPTRTRTCSGSAT